MLDNPNFVKWFADSKVVDAHGLPLVVFHGTASPNWTRDGDRVRFESRNGMGEGAYFTPDPVMASDYACCDAEVGDGDPALIPVYLRVTNPKILNDTIAMQAIEPEQRKAWEAEGHDGMFGFWKGKLCEIAVWNPSQIKAARGNSGLYDPTSTDITDRRVASAVDALAWVTENTKRLAPHA